MMENLITILIITLTTSILFIDIGKYSKNYLFMFISIIILLSILLTIKVSEGLYISFIFIIVYVSALSIMFGFLIMLTPLVTPHIHIIKRNNLKYLAIICYLLFIYIIYSQFLHQDLLEINSTINNIPIRGSISGMGMGTHQECEVSIKGGCEYGEDYGGTWWVNKRTILNKLGIELYSKLNNLFKLFLSLIILLISLFSLFFIFKK